VGNIEAELGVTVIDTTGPAATVKAVSDEAELLPTVTEIRPVMAAAGTVTVNVVDVAAVTAAGVPLKLTVLEDSVVLNP
jgi:hypothetical protein